MEKTIKVINELKKRRMVLEYLISILLRRGRKKDIEIEKLLEQTA